MRPSSVWRRWPASGWRCFDGGSFFRLPPSTLSGARAQEESLARASGLYACLAGRPMYDHHRALGDPMYTGWVMRSPGVPVFRNDDGGLLEEPHACTFLTSPAVNAKAVLAKHPAKRPAIRAAMAERIARVLAVAATHGERALVLGAWGCGAFGNDGEEIAGLFAAALADGFQGAFERVVFAIVDWSEEERFIGPFRARFAAR